MQFKVAALWTAGKLLAVAVFLVTSLTGCGVTFKVSSALFFPAQTEFAGGPPATFMVVTEDRTAAAQAERFSTVPWHRVAEMLGKNPASFRLSVREYKSDSGDPWRFKVLEETPAHQVIELWRSNTQSIHTRYRIEGGRISPMFYQTDGGVSLMMMLMPVFLLCLWLGVVAAKRSVRWVQPAIDAARAKPDTGAN